MCLMKALKNFEKMAIIEIRELVSLEVPKNTSAKYPWNNAFSGKKKNEFLTSIMLKNWI